MHIDFTTGMVTLIHQNICVKCWVKGELTLEVQQSDWLGAPQLGSGVGRHLRGNDMLRGSCLCGSVTYEVHGNPQAMYYCHCSMCRKASGSSFATNMLVKEADFVFRSGQDLVKSFQSSSGEHRYFCSGCGSPIYSKAAARQGVVSVRCGTLDDDPLVRPAEHIYVGSKAPWFEIHDHVRQYEAEPEP